VPAPVRHRDHTGRKARTGAIPDAAVDAANSATTVRLLAGAVAARPFTTRFTGDPSLRRRPMRRLIYPLSSLGAGVTVARAGTLPITITGAPLVGATVWLPEASAQVRSAFALAALQAEGISTVDSPPGFRDHTERWLQALGRGRRQGDTGFEVHPGPVPTLDITVPGDPSSAAFFWTAAAMSGAEVTTPGVSLNPGRTGLLDVMAAMGAKVQATVTHEVLGDPVGTVTVQGPVHTGMRVSGELTVRALDELPLVGLLGTVAEGETVVADAAELRLKESDRIAATVRLVTSLGGSAEASPDGFLVSRSPLRSGAFYSAGDHRMAMAGAVAATVAGTVTVVGMEAAAVSWPAFAETLEQTWSSQ
jgi:3-phosphoshikimate 1-carboxyvinyltransferase